MVTQTKSKPYVLPGNPVISLPVPVVGHLVYDGRGEPVYRKLNERFRGIEGIEDTHEYKPGEPISFSNIPRQIGRAQLLRLENDSEITVLDPIQMVQYWDLLLEKPTTYDDSSTVSVFPNEGPNETLRKRVLALLGKDKTEIPLLVVGLDIEPDDDTGFTFIETPWLKAIEAPFLTKNQIVKYDPEKDTLIPSDDNTGVQIYVPSGQSGLRRAYRGGDDSLYFRYDSLLSSKGTGRVPVIQDPKGRAENLDNLVN